MSLFFTMIKLILMLVSCLGTWEFLRRRTGVHVCFLPGLAIAVQTCILFAAGLLNILGETALLLYLAGIGCVLWYARKDRGVSFLKHYRHEAYLFSALTVLVMLFFVRGKLFTHYDNFTHWGLVVKYMLAENRYPNFADRVIIHKAYPLGSATWIYFYSRFISSREPAQMMAQICMMTASVMPLFIFSRKHKAASLVAVTAFANLAFVYNIAVTDLLVDTLLPLIGMSALLYVRRYCGAKGSGISFFLGSAYLIQLMQIKNSGIFFVLIAVIWIVSQARGSARFAGRAKRTGRLAARAALIAAPFLSLFLWQKHCVYVFDAAATSKHAMTADNYSQVFREKTAEDIRVICRKMADLAFGHRDVWLVFAFLLTAAVLCGLICRQERKLCGKLVLFSVLMYAAYQLGMLGMYLFSMPLQEALILAQGERYTKTILIAILYLSTALILKLISETEGRGWAVLSAAFCIAFTCLLMHTSLGSVRWAGQYLEDPGERKWFQRIRRRYEIEDGASVYVVLGEEDGGYAYFMGRYVFMSDRVLATPINSAEEMDKISAKYLLFYGKTNQVVKDWVASHYPDQAGSPVIVREVEP